MTMKNTMLVLMVASIISISTFSTVYAEKPVEKSSDRFNDLVDKLQDRVSANALEKIKERLLNNGEIQNKNLFKKGLIQSNGLEATFQPMLTSYWSPNNDRTFDETQAKLQIFRTDNSGVVGCSGTLIDRTHVLSAGHCFTDTNGVLVQDSIQNSLAYFYDVNQNEFVYVITDIVLHPQYDGKGEKGFDLSILTLDIPVDVSIPTIQLDRNPNDDVSNNIIVESFGVGGYGSTGFDSTLFPFGIERRANTQVDAFGDTMYQALGMIPNVDYQPQFVLQTDFDNGGVNTDAFGFFFGISQLGTGTDSDGSTCFGDSGGAIFNQYGEATGVNSYVTSLSIFGQTTDQTPDLDCSFGEFTGHIRVSKHVQWIDSVLVITPPDPEPEPDVTCGYGTLLDESVNQCVVDPAFQVTCGTGTMLDASTNQCVVDMSQIDGSVYCGKGTTWNSSLNECRRR